MCVCRTRRPLKHRHAPGFSGHERVGPGRRAPCAYMPCLLRLSQLSGADQLVGHSRCASAWRLVSHGLMQQWRLTNVLALPCNRLAKNATRHSRTFLNKVVKAVRNDYKGGLEKAKADHQKGFSELGDVVAQAMKRISDYSKTLIEEFSSLALNASVEVGLGGSAMNEFLSSHRKKSPVWRGIGSFQGFHPGFHPCENARCSWKFIAL